MGLLKWFLFVYVLGGITFLPLLLICAFVVVYLASPPPPTPTPDEIDDPADLIRDDDDKDVFKSGTDDLVDKFHRKHDGDVAAGYFAVCREFVPGGVRGRPPEKATPAGEAVVNESSPSVYQTMYRSIFDRPQKPTIEPQKDVATTKNAKKTNRQANNIFYVVLRHGHLMLYDDIQQLEVRYVISLDYHDVDIYSGNDEPIPEGELWSKRYAIRLKRKPTQLGDRGSSLPFFLFTEYVSDKEDFYFALLKNQRRTSDDVPEAETFDIKHIVSLVQKLHSSEEHLATRWLNALVGRLFLALYRTEELENFIRAKLMKKLSRVKKPNFITRLALRKINLGTGAPFITNPRLKDLTVNGDCTIEADVDYSGNFRLELGATARIDLGTRFKPRDVDLVLTVTVKKLRGHGLLHLKPPPSNRAWIAFEKMPHLELAVEPIVSSRQITLTVVLRAIESRIREVVAESLVLPFWDDVPFLLTFNQKYRGGIWKREEQPPSSVEVKTDLPEDETEPGGSGHQTPESIHLTKDDRNLTMPILPDTKKFGADKKSASLISDTHSAASDRTHPSPPRLMRSSSLATAADPKITIGPVDSDGVRLEPPELSKRDSASVVLKDLTARSQVGSASGSPPVESSMATAINQGSDSLKSKTSSENIPAAHRQYTMNYTTTPRSSVVDLTNAPFEGGLSASPGTSTPNSRPASIHGESTPQKTLTLGSKSLTAADRKKAVASAQASAQKWSTMGWGVLARNKQQQGRNDAALGNGRPSSPMGRGQPLPPPGQPLPAPQKPLTIAGMANSMLSRRKPAPTKKASDRANGSTDSLTNDKKVPTLPKRPPQNKRKESSRVGLDMDNGGEDEVMVVEAPIESQPASPAAKGDDLTRDDFFGHSEDSDFQPTDVQQENNNAVDEDASDSTDVAPDSVSTNLPDTTQPASSHRDVLPSREFEAKGMSTAVEPDTPSKTSPTLHSRRTPKPLSPSSSGTRSPLAGNAMGESEDGLSSLPQAVEASNRERSLSYMEAASGGGGYNE
ncbi:hypothetical protein DV736_g4271, partial [Chaetothyriales sp. CBS 134916]